MLPLADYSSLAVQTQSRCFQMLIERKPELALSEVEQIPWMLALDRQDVG
jgi:hypothetical protein